MEISNQMLKNRNKYFTITKQNIPLLDGRPKVKDELIFLLQNIKAFG
jgi:hypothetical protein